MTPAQVDVVLKYVTKLRSYASLVAEFGVDFQVNPQRTAAVLENESAARDSTGLEMALILTAHFGVTPAHLPLLRQLVTQLWHKQHENVASMLEQLKDPSSIADLFEAASTTYRLLPYLEYDDGHAFARKCTWALAKIDTTEAWSKLEQLAASDDPEVQKYASKRIADRGRSPA